MRILKSLARYCGVATLALGLSAPVLAQGNAWLAGKEADIAKFAQKLAAIDERRREDARMLEDVRKRMDEAGQELKAANSDFGTDGSEMNARRVKNAEFAFMLKQREYDRYQEKLQNYDVATKQTQQKIAAVKQQVDDIKAGKAAPAAAPPTDAFAKTQQELEAARARNEAAKQELTKLRAMMAEANNPKTAAAMNLQATNPQAASPQPAVVKAEVETAEPASAPAQKSVALTAEQKFAIGQYERIASLFRQKGLDNSEGADKEMLVDAMVDFWIESKRTLKFGYLGHGQYIVETKLRNGDATFIVDEQRWKYTVPEQDDNMTYMFLLDTTAKPEQQLYFFRKDLLLVD